jgi:hypothetical protein
VPKFRQNEKNQNKKECYYFVKILLFYFSGEEIIKFWENNKFEDFSSHLDNYDFSSVAIF